MQSTHTPTLSVIITAHSEGILLHHTLASVERAAANLGSDYTHEIVLHADNPTPATLSYIKAHENNVLKNVIVLNNTFGDLGTSRNFAIKKARGKYIATIDADDLMSQDWLASSLEYLESCKEPTIAHSEYTVEFEGANSLIVKHGEIDYDTDTLLSVYANRWNSVIVAPRELMLANPYAPNSPGYGYEDWHFNCRMINQRVHNVLIPETAVFVRRKLTNSEWARQVSSMSVLRANPLLAFENIREIDNPFDREFVSYQYSLSPTSSINDLVKGYIKNNKHSHAIARRIKLALKRDKLTTSSGDQRVKEWLQEEWKLLHEIDRQIYPTKQLMMGIPVYDTLTYEHRLSGHLYKQLIDRLKFNAYSYVIFVPWLIKGGADKYAINYANAIADITNTKVLVISTLNLRSSWQAQLSDNVDFLEFGIITELANPEIKHRLMEHMIENSGISTLHVINSEFGYDFVRLHENYIRSSKKKVVITSFSQSVEPETGRLYGYSHTHVPFVYDIASVITSDNQAVIDMWEREYGFDPKKMRVHRQALEISRAKIKKSHELHRPLRILWAGRVAPEKLPELIPLIAGKLSDYAHIDMYGAIEAGFEDKVSNLQGNVTYKGSYDGFDSLDVDNYDVLLYTSLFDGMPNIILEAATRGLPVIASAVGGIPEFIVNEKTGLLVEDFRNPDAYIHAINSFLKSTTMSTTLADEASRTIKTVYSAAAYRQQVRDMLEELKT